MVMAIVPTFANNSHIEGLVENIDSLWLKNADAELRTHIKETYDEYTDYHFQLILPDRKKAGKMKTSSDEEEYVIFLEEQELNYDEGVLVYSIQTHHYAQQYA